MKSAIIFACLLLFSAVANANLEIKNRKHFSSEEEMSKMFDEFRNTYNKEYEHDEAQQSRYEIFKNNLKKIDELNVADPSGVYSVNEFTDLSEEEFNRLRQSNYAEAENLMSSDDQGDDGIQSTLELSDDDLEVSSEDDGTQDYEWDFDDDVAENDAEIQDSDSAPASNDAEEVRDTDGYSDEYEKYVSAANVKAPANFDWRDYKAVAHVKNQGHCGSCWAFAAIGNLEGLLKIHGGNMQALSEQNLVDCDHENHGCHGGIPSRAFKYVIKKGGLIKETAYPYKASVQTCQMKPQGMVQDNKDINLNEEVENSDKDVDYGPNFVKVNVNGWTKVPQNEDAMAKFLYKHGPLAAALHGHGWLHFYHSGIANPPNCPQNLTHGIVIVGYGEDKGKKYWIVKNSWGPLYGEKGFFRLARGQNVCNINKMVSSALVLK